MQGSGVGGWGCWAFLITGQLSLLRVEGTAGTAPQTGLALACWRQRLNMDTSIVWMIGPSPRILVEGFPSTRF